MVNTCYSLLGGRNVIDYFRILLSVVMNFSKMIVFNKIIPSVSEMTVDALLKIKLKLMVEPTAMKNKPRSKPLKGSKSDSSACL